MPQKIIEKLHNPRNWMQEGKKGYNVNANESLSEVQVAKEILQRAGAECFSADFVLEGGSIHTDGEGYSSFLLLV